MNRTTYLQTLKKKNEYWDVVIIGGGATGLGCAVDAASRGYSTVLLDMHDFAKGTSSRSTNWFMVGFAIFSKVMFRW